jgi:molybdate/tungstate transport system substrate-binding protein
MKEIAKAFMNENPYIQVLTEAAGSLESARKITELKRECDVIASADYSVIDQLLIPEFASWNIKFASNEMAIVFTDKSRRSQEINKDNWYTIMLDGNVQIGRADPNSDPCGYRSVLVAKLAEKYYQQKDLSNKLLQKNTNNIRPKETDLLALLETGNVDYIFLYRSVAEQHHLKYILLPDEVNLKQTEMAEIYGSVSVEINGKKPGEKMTQKGEPMVYGVTIPKNAPNKVAAMAFVQFLLNPEKGMVIMKKLGQDSVIPSESKSYDQLPDELKAYAKSELKTN